MSDHTMCPGCHQLRYWTDFDARCSQCRQPTPSSGEAQESRPADKGEGIPLAWGLRVITLEVKVAALEEMLPMTFEGRLVALEGWRLEQEAGPQSPPITAPVMSTAPSGAEPCSICHLPQESGPHRHPMAPVLEPDSPPECTDPATPSSSLSGQSTTPTCLVEPGCACALLSRKPPTTLWQSMQIQGKWERVLRVGCPHCDALWAFVQIVAQAAPQSETV
jgi:hypothetical protein